MTNPTRINLPVRTFLEYGNNYLSDKNSTPEGRLAVANMIESVLFETGQFAGFKYLDTDEVDGAGTRREYFMKIPN